MAKQRSQSTYLAMGAVGGVVVGTLIGVVTNNIGLWIAVGLPVGVAIGLALSTEAASKRKRAAPAATEETDGRVPHEDGRVTHDVAIADAGEGAAHADAPDDDGLPGEDPEATGRPWRPGDPR